MSRVVVMMISNSLTKFDCLNHSILLFVKLSSTDTMVVEYMQAFRVKRYVAARPWLFMRFNSSYVCVGVNMALLTYTKAKCNVMICYF